MTLMAGTRLMRYAIRSARMPDAQGCIGQARLLPSGSHDATISDDDHNEVMVLFVVSAARA